MESTLYFSKKPKFARIGNQVQGEKTFHSKLAKDCAKLKKLACLPFTRKCPVQISVDRTIINNTTKHLNISFRYPMHVTLNFEFLEIVLLMRFSSKYSPHIHKELALLCEYINLQKSFIPKKMKDLEFVHKFNIERLQSTNLHSIEVI